MTQWSQPVEVTRNRLLILMDGHALVHRAFHAIQHPLTLSGTGEDVRGVYGFLNGFLRTISDWNPTHVSITFDLPTPTFRHKLFVDYKAHRPPTPPELRSQFDRVRQLMRAFKVPIYEIAGYEADDLLGTLCSQAEGANLDSLILTGDSDTLQLVSPRVRVLMNNGVQKRSLFDIEAVRNRYGGLGPECVSDIKALQGDPSDNIPGVPGIGIKTAISLLSTYASIEGIYRNLAEVTPVRIRKSLEDSREIALRSSILTKIVTDAPVSLDLHSARFGSFERQAVLDVVSELEFHSIAPRIPTSTTMIANENRPSQVSVIAKETTNTEYVTVDSIALINDLIRDIDTPHGFSFDTETTSTDPMSCELVGISVSTQPGKAWYIPIGHKEGKQLQKTIVLPLLKPIMEKTAVPVRAHNANFDVTVMEQNGISVRGLQFDTMIAAHINGKRNLGLKALALEYFNQEMTQITELIGTGRAQITMAQVTIEDACRYAAADADFTERLHNLMTKELKEKRLTKLYFDVELPLISVLVQIQRNGIALNTPALLEMSKNLGSKLERVRTELLELVGHDFNLNSPKQLSHVLFHELNLPPTKKTQSGFSTAAQSLDELKGILDRGGAMDSDPRAYQVLNQLLEYREIAKLKSTYVDALPGMVNPNTGRIHTSYRQTGTATGRISSNEPNLQNIPVRTDMGRRVREAFIARKDHFLVSADYSQIELRVLAHLSRDPALIEAFQRGDDIHTATSSLVYDVPLAQVTQHMRRVAKVLNFGVIYGLSPHGIARQTNLSQKEGRNFIDIYFNRYRHIQKYLDEVKMQCKENGYVETLLGRRRYLPDINARNFRERSQAERAAVNMPIQGTAADIIKVAMLQIHNRLESTDMQSLMLLQVHDELIFEVPAMEMEQLESIILDIMPRCVDLEVPLTVEIKRGVNWGSLG